MPRKKTHNEYVKQVEDKAPHINVLETYLGNRIPIKHYCSKHQIEWTISPFNFLQHPTGCYQCQQDIMDKYYSSKRKTNEQFLKELKCLNSGITPLCDYQGYNEKMNFKCKHEHVWESTPHYILSGYGCPYCSGQAILTGFNDLWTTHSHIAQMLFDSNVGYNIGKGSNIEVEWMCPYCKMHKIASPKQVITYGLACSRCSDGISYPNKFIVSLLSQFDVDKLTPEWSPSWAGRYRYDVYFVHNGQKYVVEMDGGIGHGGIVYKTGEQDIDGIYRDMVKDKKAKEHGITLIRIDCDYKDIKQRFNYIKQSILKSDLNRILNLELADWTMCNVYATKSLHMDVAKQYDDGKSIYEIADNLHVSYNTVYSWLKRLSDDGLCSYKPIIGRKKIV